MVRGTSASSPDLLGKVLGLTVLIKPVAFVGIRWAHPPVWEACPPVNQAPGHRHV